MPTVRTTALLATGAAVAVAAGGVLLLRPVGGPTPVGIDPAAYFTPAELQRAGDYRVAQRWIAVGQLLAQGVALLLVAALVRRLAGRDARRPSAAAPARSRRIWRRPASRPLLRAAATAAAVAVLVSAAALPFGAAARVRALDAGLATGSWGLWGTDVVRGLAITAVAAAVCGAVVVALLRRFGRSWWIPASGLGIAAAVVVTFAQPLVLDPLANDFAPLRDRALAGQIDGLAQRAGVPIAGVEVVDASRRTSGINAYVTGLGPSRQVVLYDTLLERLPPAAVRAVVAHELAHVSSRDIGRGLLFAALVIPLGLLAAARIAEVLSADPEGRRGRGGGGEAVAPNVAAIVVAATLVSVPLVVAGNALSRAVEAHADAVALRVAGDPRAQIELQVGLAVANRSDVDPPRLWQLALGTHPTTVQRIGAALAYERERDAGPRGRARDAGTGADDAGGRRDDAGAATG